MTFLNKKIPFDMSEVSESTNSLMKSILNDQLSLLFPKDPHKNLNDKNINNLTTKRILLNIGYDGTKFHGNQIQANNITVEHVLLYAIRKILPVDSSNKIKNTTVQEKSIDWCGRTDKNVSAENMFCCLSVKYNTSIDWYLKNINSRLCKYVWVKGYLVLSDAEFSARFSCSLRRYRYVFNLPINFDRRVFNPKTFCLASSSDIEEALSISGLPFKELTEVDETTRLLNEKSALFLNVKNMKEFCKNSKHRPIEFYGREIKQIYVTKHQEDGLYELRISSKSFLHNQIRRILFFILFNRKGNMDGVGLTFEGGEYKEKFVWEECVPRVNR